MLEWANEREGKLFGIAEGCFEQISRLLVVKFLDIGGYIEGRRRREEGDADGEGDGDGEGEEEEERRRRRRRRKKKGS